MNTDTPDIHTINPLELQAETPERTAALPMSGTQKAVALLITACIIALAWLYPWATARIFIALATAFYVLLCGYKLRLAWHALHAGSELVVSDREIAALRDEELPTYTILVPMYKEPETLPHLVRAMTALDYPAHLKDVQLLLEEDDTETMEAARNMHLPEGIRITPIPESFPRTKPKACNIGLKLARGTYLVIYDAEDRPEPDQLKKAVAAFKRLPDNVACLQSRLNFFNPRHNLLTRWFTAEYSAWFDLQLPGLSALQTVIPLGGTSNHFVTEKLRQLKGWDAYNVTEDCDLGIRICRLGWSTRILHTTTWEEACSSLPFWIRQRTRWTKGYIQTYLVHMRHPIELLRELGLGNFIHFQFMTAGNISAFLLNPLFWILTLAWFALRIDALTALFPGLIFALGAFCLFAGNFVFTYLAAVACYRRQRFDLIKYALITPAYWVLMSIAGWRAFMQFFSNPFYWEKTQHGLSNATIQTD
jgi:cellulose synthase/poly-beta-1,6-N-acetylglucosamine synthase-like glycosyltransferase